MIPHVVIVGGGFGGLYAASWLFIHLLYLAEFDNRILVFLQWVWDYFTYRRGVRLILTFRPQTPQN